MPEQRSYTQWQDLWSVFTGNGPNPGPMPHIRDAMDAQRLAWRHTPESMFPDGYLGTVGSRRSGDNVRNAIWRDTRSYSRGVHKGERLDLSSYVWPEEFNPLSGIINEATTGLRYVSPALGEEPVILANDGKPGPHEIGTPVQRDPSADARLTELLPAWR
jgi:hypothetical protein